MAFLQRVCPSHPPSPPSSKSGDREELTAIRQEWMKLQAERVNQGFKRENMTALTQAPMAQKKRERETVNGLQTTQTNKQFVASMDAL